MYPAHDALNRHMPVSIMNLVGDAVFKHVGWPWTGNFRPVGPAFGAAGGSPWNDPTG